MGTTEKDKITNCNICYHFKFQYLTLFSKTDDKWGYRGLGGTVVGFTTTCAISAYHL
jgi:glutamate-1-semialdehyde aminotransferase